SRTAPDCPAARARPARPASRPGSGEPCSSFPPVALGDPVDALADLLCDNPRRLWALGFGRRGQKRATVGVLLRSELDELPVVGPPVELVALPDYAVAPIALRVGVLPGPPRAAAADVLIRARPAPLPGIHPASRNAARYQAGVLRGARASLVTDQVRAATQAERHGGARALDQLGRHAAQGVQQAVQAFDADLVSHLP